MGRNDKKRGGKVLKYVAEEANLVFAKDLNDTSFLIAFKEDTFRNLLKSRV